MAILLILSTMFATDVPLLSIMIQLKLNVSIVHLVLSLAKIMEEF